MLKKDNVLRMAEVRSKWCVSIYMPTDRTEPKKNRIRLKNLVFDAQDKLLALGLSPEKIARILGPVEMIMENAAFWNDPREGFAAFFTVDSFVWTSMPYKTDELVVVTDRFHLKPLLRNDGQSGKFYLLTLSQKKLKFYEASKNGMNEVFPKKMPKNIGNYLKSPGGARQQVQAHTAGGAAIYHENGSAEADKKARLLEFFKKVDRSLNTYLGEGNVPLLLAGVEYLHPIYQETNNYPSLLKEGVKGNVDEMPLSELLEKALPIVRPAFRRKREKALEGFKEKLGTGLASDKFPEIFNAVREGRVETLFVPVGRQKWGIFDPGTGKPELHELKKPGDKDLLCVMSTSTLQKGGRVFVVRPDQMPNNSSAAAIMRY